MYVGCMDVQSIIVLVTFTWYDVFDRLPINPLTTYIYTIIVERPSFDRLKTDCLSHCRAIGDRSACRLD